MPTYLICSQHTWSLQNVNDECKKSKPKAKHERKTMKKCSNTRRSNLQKGKQRRWHLIIIELPDKLVIKLFLFRVLACRISAWIGTRWWRIIRVHSLSLRHTFTLFLRLAFIWLATWLTHPSEQVCGVWTRVLYRTGWAKQTKMPPISLKDPNIQAITEEFVKTFTGFKVIYITVASKYGTPSVSWISFCSL